MADGKKIRGKVALIFHLLIMNNSPPPTYSSYTVTPTPTQMHTNSSLYVHMCVQTVQSWTAFWFSLRQTGKYLQISSTSILLHSFLSLLFCTPSQVQPGLPPPTHLAPVPSSLAASQQSREQSLGGSTRLNCHCNPLAFHLLVLS